MASIHFTELQRLLFQNGQRDALPPPEGEGGMFVEIRFDAPGRAITVVDEEMKDRVITADCAYGVVTIQFDSKGELKSIDIS